jgi:hypothetical protein
MDQGQARLDLQHIQGDNQVQLLPHLIQQREFKSIHLTPVIRKHLRNIIKERRL